jgi:hypothetical protein
VIEITPVGTDTAKARIEEVRGVPRMIVEKKSV